MSEQISLSPSMLLLDPQNPRLAQPSTSQREILRAIAREQKQKLVNLARDIIEHGVNPGDLPYVMPAKDGYDRYIVLEGNRRVGALRALENPELIDGEIDAKSLGLLRKLSKTYQESPIESLQCVSFRSRRDAEHWIMLRHTGENEGAGIVRWVADQAARFKVRSGSKEIHSQALDFLESRNALTPDERSKVPSTSLKRLLGTPHVREKLGLALEKRELKVLADESQVAKALRYVAMDLANKNTKTEDIYTERQRIKYADQLPKAVIVKHTLKKPKDMATGPAASQSKAKQKSLRSKPRNRLIPRDCVLSITHQRISDIERELRELSLEDHNNAVSVLLRVFIELSANVYIDSKALTLPPAPKLRQKLHEVVKSLVASGKLSNAQAKPVRAACQKSALSLNVDQMHDYVHNQDRFPGPSDLRAFWGNFQPFVMAIWSP